MTEQTLIKKTAAKIQSYGVLVMFRHTIFSLSFGLVSLLLATGGRILIGKLLFILIALLSARTGANAINRVIDANIDAKNPRTATRQLPGGKMSKKEALIFSLACFGVMVLSVFFINRLCLLLLPFALLLMWAYSYTKRFTWLCHLFLGFTCALAPLGAWLAITGSFGGVEPALLAALRFDPAAAGLFWQAFVARDPIFIPLFLAGANAFWVAGFDIIYGAQDVAFDRSHGIHSMPARFGIGPALGISTAFHVLAVLFLWLTGLWSPVLGLLYQIGVTIVAILLLIEHLIVKPDHLDHVRLASYGLNEVVGIVFLVFAVAAVYF